MLTKKCNFGHFGPFLAPFLALGPLFGVSQNFFFLWYKFLDGYILPYKSSEWNNLMLSRYLKKMLSLNFLCFLCMVVNPPDKRWEKWALLFDSGLGLFDAENIGVVLKENAESPFVAIILIVSLVSLHYIFNVDI